ncbi:MAG: acyl-CoA reductase [Bacteroidales bacterium]|nr:acyl-CoA reductase [Bacteroidales bacterium]
MTVDERICAFKTLSSSLYDAAETPQTDNSELKRQTDQEYIYNPWFIPVFVRAAIVSLAKMLSGNNLEQWILPYRDALAGNRKSLRTGVITAGNIPLVGFHDFLSVLIAGDTFVGKLSSKDDRLLPLIAEMLCRIEPRFSDKIEFCSGKLSPVDRVIATGSNHSANIFSHYFQKYPSIIRKHCNSIAVLDGNETGKDLLKLADDVFLYFGLGCRSVSKIYVPFHYDFTALFHALDVYKEILSQHHTYLNNLEYQKTVHLLNAVAFLDQGICIFKEETALNSPVGVIHYQYYDTVKQLVDSILFRQENIQCIVSNALVHPLVSPLGESQHPKLNNYANGIDIMQFLTC